MLKDFKDWFGAATRYRYKKTASTDDWNEITPLDLSKEYTLASGTVTVEKYIKTGGSWINPTMEWVQAGTFTVKNYSNVTFNVTNIEGAGVKIDAVSYTHLDVYKRQSWRRRPLGHGTSGILYVEQRIR